jgi:DNA-binding CsgD family transcriptional regulator
MGAPKTVVTGQPDKAHVSTSFSEWQTLTIRTSTRRFTNAFSKKVANREAAVALASCATILPGPHVPARHLGDGGWNRRSCFEPGRSGKIDRCTYLSPTVSRMVELPPEEWEEARRKEALLAKLTPHEQDSLQLAAEGEGVKQIAAKLGCKPHTANNALAAIRGKTDAHSTPEACFLTGLAGIGPFGHRRPLNPAGAGAGDKPLC